jgi:hypothetical protein
MTELPEPKKYYGVDAEPDFSYYTEGQMHAHAADVSAALREHRDSAERLNLLLSMDNVALRDELQDARRTAEFWKSEHLVGNERVRVLRETLKTAEAALADIGDATREPGDDLAWCERRAAQALPAVRAALKETK